MKPFPSTFALTLLLAGALLSACHKPEAQSDSESDPSRSGADSTIAAAKPIAPAPTPEYAPPGVFYLVMAARIETASGITGLPPGTGVKLLHGDVYLTPAGEAHLQRGQLTNDMTAARAARDAEQKRQSAAQARIAADAAALAARNRAQAQSSPSFPPPVTGGPPLVTDPPPGISTPTPPPLGTNNSLSRKVDPINTTHSSTKDKVYTDSQGRQYWKDIYGHGHYF